jgi:carboxymethylenebutenolidase
MSGQDIDLTVDGRPAKGYLALPKQSNAPGVIVLHAWWGLNPFFKSLCDRLASEGFVAFAPDLNEGKIATTVDEAKQIMSEGDSERKHAVVASLVDFMHGRPEVRREALSLIGFSMGAAWSLELASQQPQDIHKVVLFYGSGDAEFSKIEAEILGHYSDADEWEPLNDIRAMEADMRTAGLNLNFHIYPNVSHWFFEDDRPEFDLMAAELAWTRTLEFLRK